MVATERISTSVPTTRRGFIGPKWRISRPIKNLKDTPPQFSRPYDYTYAYILNDIDPDDDRDLTNAQREHRTNCDNMRYIFNEVIDTDNLESVTFGTGPNSTADYTSNAQLQAYFVRELSKMDDRDLVVIYLHASARGNGDQYEWMNASAPGRIDAFALFETIIDQEKNVLIILDGPMPTRFGRKLDCPHSSFEIMHTSGPLLNAAGGPYQYHLTEAIHRTLPLLMAGTWKIRHRKSIPQTLARDKSLWNNPQRQWTAKTKSNSTESIVRFCVEPDDIALLGKIRIHGCEIQGDWCPVTGAAPTDDDGDDHDSGNEGGDDDSDGVNNPYPLKRQRGRKAHPQPTAKKSRVRKATTTTKKGHTSAARSTAAKNTSARSAKPTAGKKASASKRTGRERGGRNKTTALSAPTINDLPLLNLRGSSIPPETDDEALITPKEADDPYQFFKREPSILLSDDDDMKMESDIEVVSFTVGPPPLRGDELLFVSESEKNDDDDDVHFVSMRRDTVNIDSDDY
ncbi:hypothetical protein B0A48_09696 [Cryoendolithus antarcticus]|uniref:Uncharacterized protein n=1 Tax=Cryoendolithus antarcticus TaxID=1507870 RepID=A0A1V8T0T0_9PEZI|nr:hypothetical protein B0A48_09696 [Cryoendolithus antarcticus]